MKLSHLLAYLPAACPSGWLVGYPDARLLPVICQAVTCHLSSCYLLLVLCYLSSCYLSPHLSPVTCHLSSCYMFLVLVTCQAVTCFLIHVLCYLPPVKLLAFTSHLSTCYLLLDKCYLSPVAFLLPWTYPIGRVVSKRLDLRCFGSFYEPC